MKTILVVLLFILGILVALAVGGGLLALLVYGVGWLLNLVMHFDPFQATLISLGGVVVFGILAERVWAAISGFSPFSDKYDDDDDEYEDDEEDYDEDEDEDEDEEEVEESVTYPGIPRWRQPLKYVDFANTKPDDRCPCGSGRKYKNCHGAKRPN